VWLTALDPTVGGEIRKPRPCLIVSPLEMHDYLRTAIIAPMTTRGRPAPYRVPLRFQGRAGLVLLDQVRAVDKTRLIRRLGAIGGGTLVTVLAALQEVFEE
jgi:mRNA interferase MazF